MLMTTCLEEVLSRKCDVVWLDVWKENPRGIAFHQKWGFSIVVEQGFHMEGELLQDWIIAKLEV